MNQPAVTPVESDSSLVAAAMAGNHSAHGQLYDRYAPLIRSLCFDTTLNLAQSQDLCQETFLRAYRKLGELRDGEKFPAWLCAIARFVCREWRRGKARDRHRYLGLTPADDVHGTDVIPPGDDELKQLHTAIAQLPKDQQLALHLFYLKEQPADQARTVMNLSRAGFYKVLERARQNLAQILKPNNEDNHERPKAVSHP